MSVATAVGTTQAIIVGKQQPGDILYEQTRNHLALWAFGSVAMYGLVYNDPRLRQVIGDRGEAELGYQFVAAIFGFAAFTFFLVFLGASSRERKSVALALTSVCGIAFATYGFIIPNRLGLTFQDANGNPLDLAPHWEALVNTPVLIHIIGEVTKSRKLAFTTAFWNYPVFIFGALGMLITTKPMSPLMMWFSIGTYSITLKYIDRHFDGATASGSTMSENSLVLAKYATYIGNWGPAIIYGLHRFEVIPFAQFVVLDGIGQWFAKFVFGMIVLTSLGDKLAKQD